MNTSNEDSLCKYCGNLKKFDWPGNVSDSAFARAFHFMSSCYGHFTEGVKFAYRWIFIGGGSAINGATPSSFLFNLLIKTGSETHYFERIPVIEALTLTPFIFKQALQLRSDIFKVRS